MAERNEAKSPDTPLEETSLLPTLRKRTTMTEQRNEATSQEPTADDIPHPPSSVVVKRLHDDTCSTAKTSLWTDEASDGSEAWEPTGLVPNNDERDQTPAKKPQPKGPWSGPYDPAPVVDQNTVLLWGFILFGLSLIWPPLILLFAYLLSKVIPYSYRTNDCPATRRRLFKEFSRLQDLPENFRSLPEEVNMEDSYWTNQRGMLLHTITMLPARGHITAVVFYCHGYTDNVCFEKLLCKQRLVSDGIAFCAIEYEGHGLSDGPMGLISDWDRLVEDVVGYAKHISQRFHGIPLFLMGESMGGAVAYSVQRHIPDLIRGVVFVCPMCKISEKMLPPQPVIDLLRYLIGPRDDSTSWLGYLPLAPARDEMRTHKSPEKLLLASRVPLCFGRNPRLATARELIDVTQHISSNLKEFDAPFLVVHGSSDTVTDPQLSRALYEESKSKDKSIKIYDGMWHALMCGEPDANVDIVFRDCVDWILERAES